MGMTTAKKAQVMLESNKPGVVIGFRSRDTDNEWLEIESTNWNWELYDYCVMPPKSVLIELEAVKEIIRETCKTSTGVYWIREHVLRRLDMLAKYEADK